MKKNKLTLLLFLAVTLFSTGYAQEFSAQEDYRQKKERKVRPVRIGAKLGLPNLIGGNIEYVTPLFNDRLSVSVDYSTIRSDWFGMEEGQLNFSYWEGGVNYYLFRPGSGLYTGLSYGSMKLEEQSEYTDYTQIVDFSNRSFNIKIGAKLGGLFYFRPEIGYTFSPLPKSFTVQEIYRDGTRDSYKEEFDIAGAELLFNGLIGNIGFGFAF